jgi:hypothetical protein
MEVLRAIENAALGDENPTRVGDKEIHKPKHRITLRAGIERAQALNTAVLHSFGQLPIPGSRGGERLVPAAHLISLGVAELHYSAVAQF